MPPFLAGENPENDAARIEQLLRLGAHAILGGGEGGAAGGDAAGEDKGFAGEDIDQVCSQTHSQMCNGNSSRLLGILRVLCGCRTESSTGWRQPGMAAPAGLCQHTCELQLLKAMMQHACRGHDVMAVVLGWRVPADPDGALREAPAGQQEG